MLISGSWDGTARRWNVSDGRCLATMDGHKNIVSVRGLLPLDSSTARFVTGSAGIATDNVICDHTIRLWNVNFSETGASIALSIGFAATVTNDHDGSIRGSAFDVDTAMLSLVVMTGLLGLETLRLENVLLRLTRRLSHPTNNLPP